jgi:ABC-type Fe3+-hydroxamate transport system substrate-binding protein
MKPVFLALLLLFTGACASSFSTNETSVIITSNPSGQEVTITDKSGKVIHKGVTPETVMLNNKAENFSPEKHKIVVGRTTVHIHAKLSVIYFFNALNPVGFLVDFWSGSMWNLPDTVHVHSTTGILEYSIDTINYKVD